MTLDQEDVDTLVAVVLAAPVPFHRPRQPEAGFMSLGQLLGLLPMLCLSSNYAKFLGLRGCIPAGFSVTYSQPLPAGAHITLYARDLDWSDESAIITDYLSADVDGNGGDTLGTLDASGWATNPAWDRPISCGMVKIEMRADGLNAIPAGRLLIQATRMGEPYSIPVDLPRVLGNVPDTDWVIGTDGNLFAWAAGGQSIAPVSLVPAATLTPGGSANLILPVMQGSSVYTATAAQGREVRVKRGDTPLMPFDFGADYTGWTAHFGARRAPADAEYSMDERQCTWLDAAAGQGTIVLTAEDTATVGVHHAEIELRNGDKTLTAMAFRIVVLQDVVRGG